jgi:hypothetical protein
MQILTIKNPNFGKPSWNSSDRTKVNICREKNFLDSLPKKFVSAYAQLPRKCSNIKILANIEGKQAKFFLKIDQGHIRFGFR